MAFTLLASALLALLPLTNAQFFGNSLSGGYPGLTQSLAGAGGFPTSHNALFGGGVGQPGAVHPAQVEQVLATCRAVNKAGNIMVLTLRNAQTNPYAGAGGFHQGGLFGSLGLGGPYSPLGAGLGLGQSTRTVQVGGTFVKSQELDTNVANPASLKGKFHVVFKRYGTTEANCIAMGPPVAVPASTQLQASSNPYTQNPFGSIHSNPFAQSPFSSHYNSGLGGAGHPGSQVPLVLNSVLDATADKVSFQGFAYGTDVESLLGCGVHVCVDSACTRPTDLCCSIVKAGTTPEELEEHVKLQLLLEQHATGGALTAPLAGAGDTTGGGLF